MKQDSNMEADSALPECEEKEVGMSDVEKTEGYAEEFSTEHEGKRKEAVTSAVQEDSKMKEDSPTEQVDDMKEAVTEVRSTTEAGKSAEKCIKEGLPKKKIVKVLKVKKKIVKKSPASSVLKKKKALVEQEDDKKEKEVPVAQEVGESLEPQSLTESSNPESKTKKNDEVLKVKRKIVKKSPASSQKKTNKLQSSPKVQVRKKVENSKSLLQENGEGSEKKVEDTEKPNQKENTKESISKGEHIEKGEETSASHKHNSETKSSIKEGKIIGKAGSSDKSIKNQKKKEDRDQKSRREDKNKENLGGLIFMCSAKTKPDCFQYNVMGVSAGKKDVVLAIKPGLKLFLYDFDLRLLYGIYKASSSGGMKLEPKAFNGAFPAQVRFNIYKDCFPLPENIFKKAIQENYYEKHKFKAELTVKQVRKLSDLFRPVGLHLSSAPVRSHSEVPIRDRNVHGEKDVRIRNSKSKGDARKYHLSSHGRDRHREEAPRHREEVPRDLYLSEKDYRTYGLRAERRNLDPVPQPSLETYRRDHDRDYQLRQLEPRYRDDVSTHAQREIVRADHVYFNGKDYPVYSIDSRHQVSPPRAIPASGLERAPYDSIYTRQYGLSSIDPFLLSSRREEAAPPTYSRSYGADTEPMRHAAGALSHYNQVHHKDMEKDTMPVSSRYSFAGPSFSYR
ncbi:uncharacterized protein LOC120079814 [Benincasa hispida]|uniref:uncharacterized protein LOC120079814 n=1 Tax=Benincasa hispida TaxID=102211 RepID=UPI001900A87B|nr:uncharacterized protein LOC120079814 [Benincasa hispida]XP_038890153.1 uncharacterized protein LOC120079814 [Benincasa hispida]XP_038890154.1 uncharacterized protein LOC120079814 [Benincasa hispida]